MDGIAHRLIHRAARRAPDSLSDRLEEEWLAELASQRGSIQRLRFALGCCWATNVIAHEHAVAALPVAGSLTTRIIEPPPRSASLSVPQATMSSSRIILPPQDMPPIESDPPDVIGGTVGEPERPTLPPPLATVV